jgi:hypothetical protein
MQPSHILAIVVIAFACVVVCIFDLVSHAGSTPDPTMNAQSLIGLTADQAIARLGAPYIDTRDKGYGYIPGDRFTLTYHDKRWYSTLNYGIVFDDNHVTSVGFGKK